MLNLKKKLKAKDANAENLCIARRFIDCSCHVET